MVECSPATRAARVRFPDDAQLDFFFAAYCRTGCWDEYPKLKGDKGAGGGSKVSADRKKVVETGGIDPPTSHMLSERSTI